LARVVPLQQVATQVILIFILQRAVAVELMLGMVLAAEAAAVRTHRVQLHATAERV
jgi:hypothetical protein